MILVIGVLNSGIYVPQYMEFLGQETRYLECRSHWTREPIWRNKGRNTERVTKARKVLICEDDTYTGVTLEKVIDYVSRTLNPEQIDVCFWIDHHGTNTKISESTGKVTNIFDVRSIPAVNLLEHVDTFVAQSEKNTDSSL